MVCLFRRRKPTRACLIASLTASPCWLVAVGALVVDGSHETGRLVVLSLPSARRKVVIERPSGVAALPLRCSPAPDTTMSGAGLIVRYRVLNGRLLSVIDRTCPQDYHRLSHNRLAVMEKSGVLSTIAWRLLITLGNPMDKY